MSSTTSTSATASNTAGVSNGSFMGGGTGSSSLYLFTFLITIVVLALISGALLFRAYYVRRQFRRQVEEAIAAGRPLPENAAQALGLIRPTRLNRKKEKKHGPQPGTWEAEMHREDPEKAVEIGYSEKTLWDDVMPLSVTHTAPPPPTPPPIDPMSLMPQRRGPWFLRPFLAPRMPDLSSYIAQHPDPNRPGLNRTTTAVTLPPIEPMWTIPDDGEDVVVGVMIAMPVEGKDAERWDVEGVDPDELEVPTVCLGVMECSVRSR